MTTAAKSIRKRRKHRKPNFRDFTLGEDPLLPRSFTTNPLTSAMHHSAANSVNTLFAESSTGEPVEYADYDSQDDSEDSDYNPRHPPQLSEVAAEAFADFTTASTLTPHTEEPLPAPVPSNFSQGGYVHLPPLDSPPPRSRSGSSRGRERRDSGNQSFSPSGRLEAVDQLDVVQLPSTRPDSVASGSGSASAGSVSGSGKSTSGSSEGPHITFRYQHIQDEDGHHLIVGREGKLTQCKDEVRPLLFAYAHPETEFP